MPATFTGLEGREAIMARMRAMIQKRITIWGSDQLFLVVVMDRGHEEDALPVR